MQCRRFALGVKDLSAELAAARNAGANVIYSYTVGPENAVIANGKEGPGLEGDAGGRRGRCRSRSSWKAPRMRAEGALTVQTFIAEPSNERRASFLSATPGKYQRKAGRWPRWGSANAYDATYLLMYSFLGIRDGNLTGPAIKESLEGKMKPYYGVVTTYDRPFSATDKDAITRNVLIMGVVQDGRVTFAYPEDARRNFIMQRKQ